MKVRVEVRVSVRFDLGEIVDCGPFCTVDLKVGPVVATALHLVGRMCVCALKVDPVATLLHVDGRMCVCVGACVTLYVFCVVVGGKPSMC